MSSTQQQTLKRSISCEGIGVHSGQKAKVIFHQAPVNTGIVFVRSDITKESLDFIPATVDHVVDTSFCTTIANHKGHCVRTIEHVLAALKGCGVDNAIVEIHGEEVPIMDGSAAPFVELIEKAGIQSQTTKRKSVRVLKSVSVSYGDSKAMLIPEDRFSLQMTFNAGRRLNNLSWTFDLDANHNNFKEQISKARTFGFYEDAQKMWDAGLAQGTSLENTLVFQDGIVLNDTGLRFTDELVRHKVLDALGDLSLLGLQLQGRFIGVNSGHTLHYRLMKELLSNVENYDIIEPSYKVTKESVDFYQAQVA